MVEHDERPALWGPEYELPLDEPVEPPPAVRLMVLDMSQDDAAAFRVISW